MTTFHTSILLYTFVYTRKLPAFLNLLVYIDYFPDIFKVHAMYSPKIVDCDDINEHRGWDCTATKPTTKNIAIKM